MVGSNEQMRDFEQKDIFNDAMKKLDAGFGSLLYEIENKYPNVDDLPSNILSAISDIADKLSISPETIADMSNDQTQELIDFINLKSVEAGLNFAFALEESLAQANIDYQIAYDAKRLETDGEFYGLEGSLDRKPANV